MTAQHPLQTFHAEEVAGGRPGLHQTVGEEHHPVPWLEGLATLGPGDVVEDPDGQPLGPQLLDLSRAPQEQARMVASGGEGEHAALFVKDPIEQSGEPCRVFGAQAQKASIEAPQDDPR